MIRFADLMQASPGAMAALVLLGGLPALFGAVVMLTQCPAKTALAWSTVSQMGFVLLRCGLGLWALALLHLVAPAQYKAHGFLAAGGAVAVVPGMRGMAQAFGQALVISAAVATGFGMAFGPKSAQMLVLGAILVFGLAYLVPQGLADAAPSALTRRTLAASVGAAIGYFGFHGLATAAAGSALPQAPAAEPLQWELIVLTLVSFGLVAVAQALFPPWAQHPTAAGVRVYPGNGLYRNAILDRAIGGFRVARTR